MIECQCVQRHVPLPRNYYKARVNGETVLLCPTTYANVRELLVEFKIRDSIPPGRITKHYSRYVRGICLDMWKESKRL